MIRKQIQMKENAIYSSEDAQERGKTEKGQISKHK